MYTHQTDERCGGEKNKKSYERIQRGSNEVRGKEFRICSKVISHIGLVVERAMLKVKGVLYRIG